MFSIIEKENVQLVVPTIDTELANIAAHRDSWERRAPGLFVVSHASDFVAICRDKATTMLELKKIGLDVPVTYFYPGAEPLSTIQAQWPLIAKPIGGSSSKGVRDIRNQQEFDAAAQEEGLFDSGKGLRRRIHCERLCRPLRRTPGGGAAPARGDTGRRG